MFDNAPAMRAGTNSLGPEANAAAVFADRIELLYRLGRHHLFLPFSALCLVAVLWSGREPVWLAVLPLLLQITATVATGVLERAYFRRKAADDAAVWAARYTAASAAAGAAWGVGAFVWFVPGSFSAEAFLVLAFLGMTAAEFIARSVHRPAYVAHAVFSLGPLALRLLIAGNLYASLSAVLVLFFGGVLYSYCGGIAAVLDESLLLRRHNADLVVQLSREKAEAETARDQAEASARAKSAFIANISHEIRTPLNALLGMAQLLERSELDQTQRGHIKVLLEAGSGLKTLLDDVIALSRDEGEARPGEDEDCDPAQVARTVMRLMQPRAWEKQLKLGVAATSNLPRVAADPRCVRRVLLKLADNALKFTQRGYIELRVEPEMRDGARLVRFSVTDTGLGIPAESASRIFEPFSADDGSYARRRDGAGLGLSVAKRIVEQLGGVIGFDSEPGHGSTFWFALPVVDAPCEERQDGVAADAPPPWGLSLLVWCADDFMHAQIANMLEPFGNGLVVARDLPDAVALAARENFDAIIVRGTDADSLASAPDIRAPILAVATAGTRLPVDAAAVLRWPAAAGALYESLRDIVGRAGQAGLDRPPTNEPEAAIDAPAFAALERSLGLPVLIEILHSYVETAEQLCASLSAASDNEGWDEAMRIAQDIAGAAGGLGLAALTASARTFARCAREGESVVTLKNAAGKVVEEHRRVRRALARLYPELAAG